MRKLLIAAVACALTLPVPANAADMKLENVGPKQVPAGHYKIDPTHASLTFKVKHMGLSNYTARFAKVDATVDYDPADVSKSKVVATVDPTSIRTDYPDVAKVDFDKELAGEKFLDAAQFPTMTFTSTAIKATGKTTGTMTGDFTLHGVTKPVTLKVEFVGGMAAHPMSKQPAMGFSATGTLKRSDFGVNYGVPFVGDEVQVIVEAEFQKAE